MKSNLGSPFKPKSVKDYKPQDLTIYTLRAVFKKKGKDLLIIVFDKAVPVADAYSQTSMPSAPIIWDKKNNNSFCNKSNLEYLEKHFLPKIIPFAISGNINAIIKNPTSNFEKIIIVIKTLIAPRINEMKINVDCIFTFFAV